MHASSGSYVGIPKEEWKNYKQVLQAELLEGADIFGGDDIDDAEV